MLVHASCVALGRRAVLIRGAAGSGKSTLALQLMAFGAQLVADDQTEITKAGDWPVASAPATISGRIEAWGIGILAAAAAAPARVVLVVDLDQVETERLPPDRFTKLIGCQVPLLHKVDGLHFVTALVQYLKGGRAML